MELNQLEQFNKIIEEVEQITKDKKLKKEILKELNDCLQNGNFFIDGNVIVASNLKKNNHSITLIITPFSKEKGVSQSLKYTLTYGSRTETEKQVEYKNYLDNTYLVEKTETKVTTNSGNKITDRRTYDENSVETSRNVQTIKTKKDKDKYISEEETTIYYRHENMVTKSQKHSSYSDQLNNRAKQRTAYSEKNKYFLGEQQTENESFESIEFTEVDKQLYGKFLVKVNPKVLYLKRGL